MITTNEYNPRTLDEFIPQNMFVGTSLILCQQGKFLYGLRPHKLEGQISVVELTGIGGKLEKTDESPAKGALREAQEELACHTCLLPCEETLIVHSQSKIERVHLNEREKPAAVVFRFYRTPPHQPWHKDNQGEACLIVYLAKLDGQPYPAMELPALIWLTPVQVVQTAQQDIPLKKLIETGASFIEREPRSFDIHSVVRLTDSQEALALALEDKAIAFYQTLGETNG
jgi:hypothetical protein